jgi:hypothetical protein
VLRGMVKELQGQGIAVYLTEVHTPVAQFAQRIDMGAFVDTGCSFPTVDSAGLAAERVVTQE